MVWWKKALVVLGLSLIPVAGFVGYKAAQAGCRCGTACACAKPCPCNHGTMR